MDRGAWWATVHGLAESWIGLGTRALPIWELRAGRCVGIFPEGTRSKDGEVHHFGAGVALLASMSGAPVVPAAIVGTDKMRNLRVVYGAPISFEGKANRETLDEFSQKLREEVIKMKKACEEPEA